MARFNATQILNRVGSFTKRVYGGDARYARKRADVLREARSFGSKGIPKKTIREAEHAARYHSGRTLKTRLQAGIGTTAIVGGGFLGLHKYHQHLDNRILKRIDEMYNKE